MHPDDAVGARGLRAHPGDRNRRGVRGENRLGRTDLVELLQQRDLRVFVFDHRLDHEWDLGQVFEIDRGLDPAHDAIALLGLEAPALDHAIEVARDAVDAALAHLRGDIVHHDREPGLRRHLRDSRAHLPCPDYADLLQTHS